MFHDVALGQPSFPDDPSFEFASPTEAIAERARLFIDMIAFAQAANATRDTQHLLPALLKAISTVMPADLLGLVLIDPATGAFVIQAVHGRRRGVQIPVAAIMFDLDHFGCLNKQHGHQTGDAVLRTFAGILQERFRASDLVARYGGEEFVAILEGSTLEEATRVADEVRRSLEATKLLAPDGSRLRATVSAGCAALDRRDATREALIRAADVGLFMAKRAGRNSVVGV
jgi:diguanylate cyclase (GGDEF)-like protein